MIILGILISFIMFSIIILLHEYGHYKIARMFGIHIEEFGLGIPPRAKKLWKNKDGTLFSLNWIPLGGFVKIKGESELFLSYYGKKGKILSQKGLLKKLHSGEEIYTKKGDAMSNQERKFILARLESQKSGENFYEKHILAKSAVLLAGVVMNFILAIVIFSVLFFIGVQPVGINTFIETTTPSKIIPSYEYALEQGILIEGDGILLFPIEGSLAESAGVMSGDILSEINGEKILDIESAQNMIQSSSNTAITLTIFTDPLCGTEEFCEAPEARDVNIHLGEEGLIGSYLSPNVSQNEDFEFKYGFFESIKYGAFETYSQIRLTFSGLGILIKNIFIPETPEDRQEAIKSVAGPIGIVTLITESMSRGITILIILGAIISINLGVFNLLPIPALDGGRLILLWLREIIDKVFGKTRLSSDIESITHIIFFLLLIALSIIIAYNDIIKIFTQ